MATNERQEATECSQCAEMRAKLEEIHKALIEIRDQTADTELDIIHTAACGALRLIEVKEE